MAATPLRPLLFFLGADFFRGASGFDAVGGAGNSNTLRPLGFNDGVGSCFLAAEGVAGCNRFDMTGESNTLRPEPAGLTDAIPASCPLAATSSLLLPALPSASFLLPFPRLRLSLAPPCGVPAGVSPAAAVLSAGESKNAPRVAGRGGLVGVEVLCAMTWMEKVCVRDSGVDAMSVMTLSLGG